MEGKPGLRRAADVIFLTVPYLSSLNYLQPILRNVPCGTTYLNMAVFISHSRQNGGAALKLCDRLSQSGLSVWLDTRELDTGVDWNVGVAEAIRSADGFIIVIGPSPTPDASQQFEWQEMTELECYLDPLMPLIPVVIGDAEIPGFLRARQAITVDPSSIDFDALADRIAQSLGKPGETVDHEKLERGRAARQKALETLEKYSIDLEKDDVKRAGLRGLK
jgi:TIR domain